MKVKVKTLTTHRKVRPAVPDGELGRREQNKLEKLRRIKEAARELFISKGFDETTIREIASVAEVGLGTVFVYAANKRDLLFLIFNDGLEEVTRKAEASINKTAPLLDNLLNVFQCHYQFFARQPALSRLVLREMTFYDSGIQARSFQKTREALIDLIAEAVRHATIQNAVSATEPPQFIGWVIFCIFQVELRSWLSHNDIKLRDGLNHLRRALTLLMEGIDSTNLVAIARS